MSGHSNPAGAKDAGRIDRVARHLAAKGEAEVAMILAIARRAEALLADPGLRRQSLQPRKRPLQRRSPGRRRSNFPSTRQSRSGSPASMILRPARG